MAPHGQMSFSCTSEFFFRSICTFRCDDGFDIPKDMRRTKVCLASGYWNGADAECVGKIWYKPMPPNCMETIIIILFTYKLLNQCYQRKKFTKLKLSLQ